MYESAGADARRQSQRCRQAALPCPPRVSAAHGHACRIVHDRMHLHLPSPRRTAARVERVPPARATRIKPSVESPKSGILVTEVITFDTIAHRVILGRS